MKGYRNFIIIFLVLFVLYIIAELNKPKPVDWSVTISNSDKNPYGGYVIYQQLKSLFPAAEVRPYYLPVYNQLNDIEEENSAYLILTHSFEPSKDDYNEMMKYVVQGNYVMISAQDFGKRFLDSVGIKTNSRFSLLKDSASVNFVNPLLKSKKDFTFLSYTIDQYFSKIDTPKTIILGVNDKAQPNFIRVEYGAGALLIHAAPICFSNYFMLFANNALYSSRALSYLPPDISKIYWDEYYKMNKDVASSTPLRFFLGNEYLRWALRLTMIGLVIYILFQAKRKQRIIPEIDLLKNSSLDFLKTVSGVYYNQKDNNSIAEKKMNYFLDFVRQRFYLSTNELNEDFIEQLGRKSGTSVPEVTDLVNLLKHIEAGDTVSDDLLLYIDQKIDNFYKQI